MMKISLKAEFETLKADGKTTKRKFKWFVVLTPALVKPLQSTDMTYSAIFMEVFKQIKLGAIILPPSSTPTTASTRSTSTISPTPTTTPLGTKNELLFKMATPLDSVIYFLWTCHHLVKDTKLPVMAHLQDDVALEWEQAT